MIDLDTNFLLYILPYIRACMRVRVHSCMVKMFVNDDSPTSKIILAPYILDAATNNIKLLTLIVIGFLEALYIKRRMPSLNMGINPTKECLLFIYQ